MAITASQVKELREMTGAGMMDAKKALTETNGDTDAAVDWLRTKGLAKAAKKAGRTAAEGLVAVAVDGNTGVAVEVNSETDFVGKNAEFQDMVAGIAKVATGVDSVEALADAELDGKKVSEVVTDKIAKIGENMTLRRMAKVEGDVVASYVHNAAAPGLGQIGVLVAMKGGDEAFGKQVAMHIAAANPAALNEAELDPAVVEKERQVQIDIAREIRQAGAGHREDDRRPHEEVPRRGDPAGSGLRGEPRPDRRGSRQGSRRRDPGLRPPAGR